MRIRSLAAWLLPASALLSGCGAPPVRIDALLAPYRNDGAPGIAAMVIRDGTLAYSAGFGLADVERRIPIGPRTAFDIASMSKQFTGMLAMILHQEGRLDYDAPVATFLPELSRFGDRMTVRHLLTHTSGLPDYYDALARAAPPGGWVTNRDALAHLAREGDLLFPPGDHFQYSDSGYEMLALVLERASGEPFGDLLRDRIFTPLAMNATRLRDSPDVEVPNRARAYTLQQDGFLAMPAHPLDCLAGSGAVNTTLEDLARWDEGLASDRLVRRATLDEALRPMRLNDGTESSYGFGWFFKDDRGRRRLEHPGAWNGYQALIVRYPDERLTVVLLANRADVNLAELADRIVSFSLPRGAPYLY